MGPVGVGPVGVGRLRLGRGLRSVEVGVGGRIGRAQEVDDGR